MLNANELVRLLAEPDRRQIIAALILSPGDLASVTERTNLDLRQAQAALHRLRSAGLVEQGSDGTLVVVEETFKAAARADAEDADSAATETTPDRYFVDGRLVHLPRKRAKRLEVLDRLAQEFEPGQHYSERELNQILRAFDDDVATLRRYLVDERFLDRADGAYWRSGGSVDTAD